MKRFITYLYEYEQEQKIKSAGFLRVDERGREVSVQISVRKVVRTQEKGKVYALVQMPQLLGILLGEVAVLNGQGEVTLRMDADRMLGSPYALEDIVGIGIEFPNRGYLASCWKDEAAAAIARGGFEIWEKLPTEDRALIADATNDLPVVAASLPDVETLCVDTDVASIAGNAQPEKDKTPGERIIYRKMSFDGIRHLPRQNWYLSNNRFLIHGCSNYGYLILKKTKEADDEKTFLGVPGIFEKPEMVVAALFGFSEFEELDQKVAQAQMEETIEMDCPQAEKDPKAGSFGAWFIPLQ